MTTESGVLDDTQYSFRTRFAEGLGTNPDELIAASMSGCFSMALSNELGLAGFHPQRIETTATATLEDLAAGWTVTRIQLDVRATVPDVSQSSFMDAALIAKDQVSDRAPAEHQHQHDGQPELMKSRRFTGFAKFMANGGTDEIRRSGPWKYRSSATGAYLRLRRTAF